MKFSDYRNRLRRAAGALLVSGLAVSSLTVTPANAETVNYSLETEMWADPYDLYPDSLTTTVSLQLPSADARINSDVVFVVDISDCVDETLTSLQNMLVQLKESQDRQGVTTRIGVVFFRGSAYRYLELEELTDTAYQQIYDAISYYLTIPEGSRNDAILADIAERNTGDAVIAKGSNLDSGLQAAQAMLQEETLPGNSQYVIAVSDGISYLFDDEEGDTKAIYSGIQGDTTVTSIMALFYEWETRYNFNGEDYTYIGGNFTQADWDSLFEEMQLKVAADAGAYDVSVRAAAALHADYRNMPLSIMDEQGFPYLLGSIEYLNSHAVGIEKALVEAYDTWMEMVNAGYQCFFVNPTFEDATDTFPYFYTQMMNTASGQTGTVNFETITAQAINAVASASIQDVINPEFELNLEDGVVPFTMLRGNEVLTGTADASLANTWNFGELTDDGVYSYVVTYDASTGTIVWDINVPVVKGQELTLTYQQTLKTAGSELKEYAVSTSVPFTYTDSLGRTGSGTFTIPNVLYHPPVVIPVTTPTPAGRLVPDTSVK